MGFPFLLNGSLREREESRVRQGLRPEGLIKCICCSRRQSTGGTNLGSQVQVGGVAWTQEATSICS